MSCEKKDFTTYMDQLADRLEREGRQGTAHVYRSALRRARKFNNGKQIAFADVTADWVCRFRQQLIDDGLSWNTVSTYLRMLRAAYRRGVREHRFRPARCPFEHVRTGVRPAVKRAVDEEVLRNIRHVASDNSSPLADTCSLFLLLFLLRGIPFVDLVYLRRSDLQGDIIRYHRRKTDTAITVRVEPEAMTVIRHLENRDTSSPYLFPFIGQTAENGYRQYSNALRRFNYRLHKVACLLGKDVRLSSYTARHSWATIANHHGHSITLISNAMGHSSVRVTENYLKQHTDKKIDEMNRSILNSIFS